MEKKFDAYFEEEIPYKMTLEELLSVSPRIGQNEIQFSERAVLAYIRNCGDSFRFLAPINYVSDTKVIHQQRKIHPYYKEIHDPLNEKDFIKDHWYHPYKIVITDSETQTKCESLYFSDFVWLFKSGIFEFIPE